MADAKVQISIEVDKKTGAIKVAGQEIEGLGKKAKVAGDSARAGAGGFGALTASLGPLLAAGAVIKFFADATGEAIKQEDAINRLNTALKIQGKFTQAASIDLQNYASAMQEATRFGDDAITEQQALLISFGLTGDALKKATEAGMDLSVALGIDLRAAMLLVGKAAAGDTSSLSRYGIKIREGIPDTEKFAEVMKVLNTRFGGAARKDVETFGGSLAQLKNKMGDVSEEVGFQLIPTLKKLNAKFAESLPFIGKVLAAITGLVQTFLTGLSLMFEGAKKFADSFIALVVDGNRIVFDLLTGNFSKASTDATDLKNKLKENLLGFVDDARAANADLVSIAQDTTDRILGVKQEQAQGEVETEIEKRDKLEKLRLEEEARRAAEAEEWLRIGQERKKEDAKKAEEEKKKQTERLENFKKFGSHLTQSALFNAKQQANISRVQATFQATVDAHAAAAAARKALSGIPIIGPALGIVASIAAFAAGMANVQAIQSAKGFKHGGRVPGAGNEDSIPAVLTPGERVLTREQNKAFEQNISAGGGGGGTGRVVNIGTVVFNGVDPRTPEGRREIIDAFAEAMADGGPTAIRASRLSADLNSNNSDMAA